MSSTTLELNKAYAENKDLENNTLNIREQLDKTSNDLSQMTERSSRVPVLESTMESNTVEINDLTKAIADLREKLGSAGSNLEVLNCVQD